MTVCTSTFSLGRQKCVAVATETLRLVSAAVRGENGGFMMTPSTAVRRQLGPSSNEKEPVIVTLRRRAFKRQNACSTHNSLIPGVSARAPTKSPTPPESSISLRTPAFGKAQPANADSIRRQSRKKNPRAAKPASCHQASTPVRQKILARLRDPEKHLPCSLETACNVTLRASRAGHYRPVGLLSVDHKRSVADLQAAAMTARRFGLGACKHTIQPHKRP